MNGRVETTNEIRDFFYGLIKREYDQDKTLNLMNQADAVMRRERAWQMLKKVDSSTTASVSDTYTSYKSLPSDFDRPIDGKIYVVNRGNVYTQIPFEEYFAWKDTARRFYIDYVNNRFALTGPVGVSGPIYFPYIYRPLPLVYTDDVSANVSTNTPSWWPSDLRVALSYMMAKLNQGNISPDDISARMSIEQEREFGRVMNALRDWDADLRVSAMNNMSGFDEFASNTTDGSSGLLKLGDL